MFWLAIGAMFLTGFMNPITNGPIFAILQATVAPNMQGRIFTTIGSISGAITPLSLLVAGPIADAVGIRIWYIVGGIVAVLVGLVAALTPAIANIEQRHEPVELDTSFSTKAPPLAE
jgi:DHA3 family macrolide efflux protein-like MFS transporter